MLTRVLSQCHQAIESRYGVPRDTIRAFFHYLPTFYHLHMHLVSIQRADMTSIPIAKAVLVDDVLDNIALKHDYYQTQALSFVLGEQQELWARFQQHHRDTRANE